MKNNLTAVEFNAAADPGFPKGASTRRGVGAGVGRGGEEAANRLFTKICRKLHENEEKKLDGVGGGVQNLTM